MLSSFVERESEPPPDGSGRRALVLFGLFPLGWLLRLLPGFLGLGGFGTFRGLRRFYRLGLGWYLDGLCFFGFRSFRFDLGFRFGGLGFDLGFDLRGLGFSGLGWLGSFLDYLGLCLSNRHGGFLFSHCLKGLLSRRFLLGSFLRRHLSRRLRLGPQCPLYRLGGLARLGPDDEMPENVLADPHYAV